MRYSLTQKQAIASLLIIAGILLMCKVAYDVARSEPMGLGDVIATGLQSIGIEKSEGCKCEERQEKLNALFPIGNQAQNEQASTNEKSE